MSKLFILISFVSSTLALETLPKPHVVGGSNATRGQFKYFGSLRYRIGDFEFHGCGANILNARWALSAAHCTVFDENLVDNLDIVVGSVALSDDGVRYNIIEIINHPAYVFINLREHGIYWIINE
jgi:secreted trypsin-like serine protease